MLNDFQCGCPVYCRTAKNGGEEQQNNKEEKTARTKSAGKGGRKSGKLRQVQRVSQKGKLKFVEEAEQNSYI